MRPLALLFLLAAVLAPLSDAFAQRRGDDWGWRSPSRLYAGGAFIYGKPQGEFGDNVDQGFGGGGHLIFRVDPVGLLGLRLDVSGLEYGRERTRVPLSPTLGGRILVDLETTNSMLLFGVGPQLMVPTGQLRPYLNGSVGLAYFSTQSYIRGQDQPDEYRFGNTTHFDDVSLAYGAGAGVYIPITRRRRPISLDVGARYQRAGRAEYLVEGSITDNPDGTLSFLPLESDIDLATFHVGITVGLGRGNPRGASSRGCDYDRRRRECRW